MRLAAHSLLCNNLEPGTLEGAGYSGVFLELGDPDQARPKLDGLEVTCLGFGRTVEPAQAVALAVVVGAPNLRIFGATMDGRSYQQAFDATTQLCEAFRREAHKHNLKVLLHQRWGTLTASASQLRRVLEQFDPHEVGCIYDAGSMTIEGFESYRIGLEILGDYVADVHVANTRHFPAADGTVWDWEWSPLNDGLLDLCQLLRALRRRGYSGWLTVADRCLETPPKTARHTSSQAPAALPEIQSKEVPSRPIAARAQTEVSAELLRQGSTRLLTADRHMLEQAEADLEGIGSHNPFRPLDDHVERAERPVRISVVAEHA